MYQPELQHIINSFNGKLPQSEDFKNFLTAINTSFLKENYGKDCNPHLNKQDAILVIENSIDMIALHEPDLTCTYISPSCRDILGYDPEEVLGLTAYDYFHPDDIPLISTLHEEALKNPDKRITVTYRLRHKDGHYVWVETTAKVIVDKVTGKPKKIIAAARDITQRKQFEKELQQGQIRLELMNAIMEMRVEDQPVEVIINSTLESLKEFFPEFRISYTTLDERTGIQSLDYLVGFADDVQSMQGTTLDLNYIPEILKALKGKAPLIVQDAFLDERFENVRESIIRRGTRSIAYFPARYNVSSIGILSVGSVEVHELSSFQISAFKEVSRQLGATLQEFRLSNEKNSALAEQLIAEETIRENEARFKVIFETAGIGIVLVSPTGNILKSNPAFERIIGYSGEELTRKHLIDLTYPEDIDQSMDLFKKLIDKRTDYYTFEKRYIRKNGEVIWARVAASIVRSGEGKPLYAIGTVEDFTAQRSYTDDLEALTRELESKNSELEYAKESAETANKAKTVFLSSMSHELRTPLNAILGFAQILQKDNNIPHQQRGFIETIYKSGAHLLDMINDVLDISKIESGRMELFPDDFDLFELLNDIHDMFNHPARMKGIQLTVSNSPNVPNRVFTDAKRLRQILINLLSNAVKFTNSGYVSLHVSAAKANHDHADEVTILLFTVKDTGRGIPQEQLESIFEPFRQTSGMYSEGSGLGLAISRRIARLMNGEVYIKSSPDSGSTFVFEAPFQTSGNNDRYSFKDHEKEINLELYAAVTAIRKLPAHVATPLTEAIEVQDFALINNLLHQASFHELHSSPLQLIAKAAHGADFKTLTNIAELLNKS